MACFSVDPIVKNLSVDGAYTAVVMAQVACSGSGVDPFECTIRMYVS